MKFTDRTTLLRFQTNMSRVHSLISLLRSGIEQLKPSGLALSEGVRADILRSIVVFLHATFEDLLRRYADPAKGTLNFNSSADILKVLQYHRLNPGPFRKLLPPLTQMAKRRQRIVHNADLPTFSATDPPKWNIADEWSLILWTVAVPAFYSLLQRELHPNDDKHQAAYQKLSDSLDEILRLGHALKEFVSPQSLRVEVLLMNANVVIDVARSAVVTLTEAGKILRSIDSAMEASD